MTSTRIHYLFDPLCGWCYGASSAVTELAQAPGIELHLQPTGLFAGAGARPMDAEFSHYAWTNDQRIERLTGQSFSHLYRQQVLGNHQAMFDSGPATMALTAVALTAPNQEWQVLKTIQQARYVHGQDITDVHTLEALLKATGHAAAADLLQARPPELLDTYKSRTTHAQHILRTVGARGVPTFVLQSNDQYRQVPSGMAYENPQGFVQHLLALNTGEPTPTQPNT
ncbi:DsbA family protein [Lampropedia puyangensis]|uniref:DsbA family protein n=1 Tax=Lampropedia puyangensis TaxID=1330072 RepID=A0A4S8F992_9BURK|nr:DsbA family protein [Lampropedia puyangensis]THU04148.1 DsbA family protein [Lampropedia puyangensis]